MSVNPYFTLPTVTGATASTTDLLASVAKADAASQGAVALKTEIQDQLKAAGTNYGGSFQQGFGTSYNTNPTKAWNGAGAFPQYAVTPDGRIVPYINFLDKTAGAGMQFGLPPSVNDVEGNLKGIDPYGQYGSKAPYGQATPYGSNAPYGQQYGQYGGQSPLEQENAQLKMMVMQLQASIAQFMMGGSQGGYGMQPNPYAMQGYGMQQNPYLMQQNPYDPQGFYGFGMVVAGGGSAPDSAPALPIVELPLVGGDVAK